MQKLLCLGSPHLRTLADLFSKFSGVKERHSRVCVASVAQLGNLRWHKWVVFLETLQPFFSLLQGILGGEAPATCRSLCQVTLPCRRARTASWVDQGWIWVDLSVAVNHGQAEHKCRLSFPNPHPPWVHKPKQDVGVFSSFPQEQSSFSG